jgi:alkylation response protein AidB-like acyl-CoA dehydrogenase
MSVDQRARVERHALILHSAALVGTADRLLEKSREYALQRHQFGAPIGSYQAIKHELADAFMANTVAWNATLCAAAEGADGERAPRVCRYLTVEAALTTARVAAQLHGGIGFTMDMPVHRYLKAILDGASRFGSPDQFAEALGRRMLVPC